MHPVSCKATEKLQASIMEEMRDRGVSVYMAGSMPSFWEKGIKCDETLSHNCSRMCANPRTYLRFTNLDDPTKIMGQRDRDG